MLFRPRFMSFVRFNLDPVWVLYVIGFLETCWEFLFLLLGIRESHF